jgi:ABC-type amino acid transport substrate-binding protein
MKREFAVLGIVIALGVGILGGWFIPTPLTAPQQPSLLSVIESRGTIKVGTSADYPPFENYNVTLDVIEGFDIDFTEMIADSIGVSGVTIEWSDIPFDNLIGACMSGEIDMIAAAMTYNEDRAKSLAPSSTYYSVAEAVIVKHSSSLSITSLADLTNYQVGCQSGTVMQDELEAVGMTVGVNLTTFSSAQLLMADLDSGGIDAAYVDEPIFYAFNRTYDFKIIFSTAPEPLAFWTRYGEPELLYVMDSVILDGYQTGWVYDLVTEWFG